MPSLFAPSSKIPAAYSTRLARNTQVGAIVGSIFEGIYFIIYLLDAFYPPAIFNFIGVLLSLTGFLLVNKFHRQHLASHAITTGLLISVVGTSLISGGISSSSLPWLCFVPIAATLTHSVRSGIAWAAISVGAIVAIYLFPLSPAAFPDMRLTTGTDILIDIIGLLAVLTAAVTLSENITKNTLIQLDEVQEQLRHLTTIDPLTRAYNRRYFFERANSVLRANHGSHTAVILLDLDHFKVINDTYGHQVGDDVLEKVVARSQQHLRPQDLFARFGGEEFIILMPNTQLAQALPIIFQLREKIASHPFYSKDKQISVTISIGISSTENKTAASLDELISQADKAMYLAKENGRNRVVAWQSAEKTAVHIDPID